uniref:Thioesterase domain-containing protein n=1 Tax=Tetradesmus obliquus TaxID=3088 RepID=A0A383VFX8_TETOB|eukprot:jgi/Sobl393_1/5491/SZX64417.1
MPTSSPFEQQLQQQRSTVVPAAAGMQSAAATNNAKGNGNATQGYIVKELSVTADLIDSFVQDEAKQEPAASLAQQAWIKSLKDSSGGKVVFSAEGDGHAMAQHLSTGLSGDHLFLSLLQNDLIRDMVVIYADKKIYTALRFGVPVCGHPTIVHGGLTSAIFDETFGVLLYAAGRYSHLELEHGVFTARLEVDYKKPLPAESTVLCTAQVDSLEGRKIWVAADLTDPLQQTVYASSRALFVKPKAPVPTLAPAGAAPAAVPAAATV